MITKIQPKELKKELDLYYETKTPLFLRGAPGIGKSQIFQQFARENNLSYKESRLIHFSETDLKGFPCLDKGKGVSKWLPPEEFPTKEEPGIWVLEEFNSANSQVQAACYQLLLDRRIGEYKLPDSIWIAATGNRLGDKGIVNPLASPNISRMAHLELVVSDVDWLEHGAKMNFAPEVLSFIRKYPEHLDSFNPQKWEKETPFCCPRTLEFLSRSILKAQTKGEFPSNSHIFSLIGDCIGTAFLGYCKYFTSIPSYLELLDLGAFQIPNDPCTLHALSSRIAAGMASNPETIPSIFPTITRIGQHQPDYEIIILIEALRRNKASLLKSTPIQHWLQSHGEILTLMK
jgi:AAA domain (dynein-related subfamily)